MDETQMLSTQENVAVVKARLQEEGREARNLIAYSVPLENRRVYSASTQEKVAEKIIKVPKEKKTSAEGPRLKRGKRRRSASAGRDPHASLRARHWGFLFRNLQQAVDEIYQTAEDDESIIECKEAILMLERYTNDFYKLIEWFKIKWEYENTAPPQRPTSLAWEIRTSSPGKIFKSERRSVTLSDARRALNFNQVYPPGSASLKKDMLQIPSKERDTDIVKERTPTKMISSSALNSHLIEQNFTERNHLFQSNSSSSISNGIQNNGCAKSELYCISESQTADENGDIQKSTTIGAEQKSTTTDAEILIDMQKSTTTTTTTTTGAEILTSTNPYLSSSQISHSQNGHSELYASKLKDSSTTPNLTDTKDKKKISDARQEAKVQRKEMIKTGTVEATTTAEATKLTTTTTEATKLITTAEASELTTTAKATKLTLPAEAKLTAATEAATTAADAKLTAAAEATVLTISEEVPKLTADVETTKLTLPAEAEAAAAKLKIISEATNCTNEGTKTKDENKISSRVEKNLKEEGKVAGESEVKKSSLDYQPKHLHPKPGPLVNMNKASQVRKAFNQSRTPIKSSQGAWKQMTYPSPDCKATCSRQQGPGGRLTIRRLVEGKQTHSPPLNRRTLGQKIGPYSTSDKGIFSSTSSYPVARGLVRSSTTLDSCTRNQICKTYTNGSAPSVGKYASDVSLASSSNTSSSGQSWADKVKGNVENKDSSSQTSLRVDDDDEGWEVVRRHRRSHGGSAASLNSQKLFSGNVQYQSELEKKGSFPLQMKSRFHQPTSAVSMPSLCPSSESEEIRRRESLPRSGNASQKCQKDGTQIKRVNPKKKKVHKENSSNSTGNLSDKSATRCSRLCKDLDNSIKKTSNTDKERKDAANAKMQSKSIKENSNINTDKMQNITIDNDTQHLSHPVEDNPTFSREDKVCDNVITNDSLSVDNTTLDSPPLDNNCELVNRNNMFLTIAETSVYSSNQARMVQDSSDLIEQLSSDSESEREEEQMRCNAEAFEFVVEREKRLKEEIEETQRAPIEICDVEEEEMGEVENDAERAGVCANEAENNDNRVEKENLYQLDFSISRAGGLSWADEMDAIDKMESVRPPGRVLHIHEKLSSPSRKLPISEKLRRHEEKLAKAEELRGKRILEKTEKLRDLFRKIDEVNMDKERLLFEKRGLFERKMDRAEEKRRCHLQEIVNKAHDEENKAKEIAFINGLEAQIKLHDIMQQHQSHESRLADIVEERNRKLEEKAAKEAAAQERRKAMEAERKARMLELCEKRRKKCERIDRQQAERREELLEQAREKARDREERRSALQQAQQAKESELVKKIQQKQEETARRHEENIEQIRQKALESSIMKYSRGSDEAPKLRRYDTKRLCTLCNSVITSEVYLLSHLRGMQHQESLKELHKKDVSLEESETYNLKFIIDAPANIVDSQVTKDKERQKSLKKRCRKIRTRMTSRGKDFLKDYRAPTCKESATKSRMAKALTQIGKLLSHQGSGPWLPADVALLDRQLLDLHRMLEKCDEDEQKTFASLDGFRRLFMLLNLITSEEEESQCVIPARSLSFCAKVLHFGAKGSKENCRLLLYSNLVGNAVDQLNRRLNDMSGDFTRNGSSNSLNTISVLPSDPAAAALMELLAQVLRDINGRNESEVETEKGEGIWPRLQDVVSYCVSMGVTDKISWYFNHVQNPVENDPPSAEIILSAMSLLSALSVKLCGRSMSDDPTQLIGTFHVLDACGVVSLLYGLLLHQGGRSPSPPSVSLLSPSTLAISAAATTLLHSLAELDLKMFQAILGSEGISLEFRHIASFLLWYCSHWPCEEILHNVIPLVGFFAVNNKENQSIIQSGETPSVLQQLCSLPWPYFSESHLTAVLFPTLLACCLHNDDNLNILQQEMSFEVLEEYLHSNNPSKKPLMQILHSFNASA